ncbi:MAG: Mur ligase family protein [Candidatus Taylorbacteria bacterium]|nr:Mur ligase family protein [Candidatus Taylorbacteria bacterium]
MIKSLFKNSIVTLLTWETRVVLARYKPRVIAITGSVGKTSTKDAVWSVLSARVSVRKSEKSFNSELGVPLTVLGLKNGWSNPFIWFAHICRGAWLALGFRSKTVSYPKWLILEIGADRPGDIEKVSKWLSPDVVIITRFGTVPVHVEFFKSQKEVIREKSFLVKALKDTGLLLLNNDDADVRALRSIKETCRTCKISTWGVDTPSDVQATHIDFTYESEDNVSKPTGITFRVENDGNSIPVHIDNTVGRQHIYPALCALALGKAFNFNVIKMAESLKGHRTPPGRMRLIDGVKNTTIIDDTYNASPIAVEEALRTLKDIHISGKKIAVLGDMLELGRFSSQEHRKVGARAKDACDILVTVGVRARDIAEGALENMMDEKNVFQFDSNKEAKKFVQELLKEGDCVLVKGSQGVRMEKIVEEIMAHPELKEELLVRQEKEWKVR